MKKIHIFIILPLILMAFASCKKKYNNEFHLVCYIFSLAEGDSYYMEINNQGVMKVTSGSIKYNGVTTIEKECEMTPNIDSLIGPVGVFDSIYNFEKHKWSYYCYDGNYYAQKQLSPEEFSKVKHYKNEMMASKYDKKNSKRINIYTKEDSIDFPVIPGIVLMFNDRTYSFRERDSLVDGMKLYKYLKELSPMPIMIRPRHDCVSGEGSHTREIIERIDETEE